MKLCAFCKKEVKLDKYFSRKSKCPHCGEDLHICLNCRFYSKISGRGRCDEPKTEQTRTWDRANFCDYFRFKAEDQGTKEKAIRSWEELFKKGS